MKLFIYTPAEGAIAAAHIAPKSAIVGLPAEDGATILIYFEGNLNGAANLTRFHERLLSAAGRMVKKYPTVAKMLVPAAELHRVGTYDAARYFVSEVTDADRLSAWAGEPVGQIAGTRLPDGPCSRITLAAYHDNLRHLCQHGTRIAYRALSGQVVIYDMASDSAEVFDPDDPATSEWNPATP